ncbi:MAG: DNA-binding NtrC family response regulator [Mariniblastus sp.]|jgi:DNA-binding NtrC family response regulator
METNAKRLLVIDDESQILEVIRMAFPDFHVEMCLDGQSGVDAFLQATPDVVLCDIQLPDYSGLEVFEKLHRVDPSVPIILMTGKGTANTAIEAMQRGAFEYILKPLDLDTLVRLVEQAAETSRMSRTPARLPVAGVPTCSDDSADHLIGNCPAMQEVYRSIGRVAKQDVTVLVLGESGTGKEVIARAIYQYSSRASGRFLAINCAAIPENLLESELFGHEKGSFTGADRKRLGKFELCKDGTLFLDEIGDMTPLMQTKILRVLQDQAFERVGGANTIKTNARLIAATNVDLQKAIEEKRFREDLFYRLNVYTIQLPPLRERGNDILLLAEYFLRQYARELKKNVGSYAPETLEILSTHRWPGNVRELQSVVKHALLQATSSVIVPNNLPGSIRHSGAEKTAITSFLGPANDARKTQHDSSTDAPLDIAAITRDYLHSESNEILRDVVSLVERQVFIAVMQSTDGNLTQAAKRLGITRTTLRRRLEPLGLNLERTTTLEESF